MPGDKSISHRALIFSLLAHGDCRISQLSPAEDCQSTIKCLRALGVDIFTEGSETVVRSPFITGLTRPKSTLDAGNSGTTIRLLSGVLAGQPFESILDGDDSLKKRPMSRVLNPLIEMGAEVHFDDTDNYPPFSISGKQLKGKTFDLPIASAQVQTAILLAGLQAEGSTSVTVPSIVRDHTEKMFSFMNVPFKKDENGMISVARMQSPVKNCNISVPGDISSAAFFMVAAACLPGSKVTLLEVGLNRGRTLVIDVLRSMGAAIEVLNERVMGGEPVADILIAGSHRLRSATIDGATIATGIDEIPILALAGAICEGSFVVRDAAELRVKESDRLGAIVNNLLSAGSSIVEYPDGFEISGRASLPGGSPWITHGDHRMAMTGIVANLLCEKPVAIDDAACMAVSYPHFDRDLASLYA